MMNRKPRIYLAISTFLPLVGGAETQTMAQSKLLLAKGYAVTIVTLRHQAAWPAKEKMQGVPVLRVAGLLLNGRERLPRLLQRLLYLLAILVMSWTIWQRRKRFDVLQVCQFSLLVAPLALVCRLAGKSMTIVVISAGMDKATKTSSPTRLSAGPLDPATPWLRVASQTWINGDLYAFRKAGKAVMHVTCALLQRIGTVVIVLSTRMQHYLENNGLSSLDIQLIPNGVDTCRFHPSSGQSDEVNAMTVVCVAQLRYEKGLDVLLQAWYLVQQQLPDARLILIGSGPLQPQLERLAKALAIADSVEFAGLCSDVPQQLQRGAIAVLPSRWEGMPNALLEAMASGLACVATRVSGSEDVIQDGINGLLVAVEDYHGLAQALLTFLHNPSLTKKYGRAASCTIEQHYTLEHILNKYITTYQKITDKGEQIDVWHSRLSQSTNQSDPGRAAHPPDVPDVAPSWPRCTRHLDIRWHRSGHAQTRHY